MSEQDELLREFLIESYENLDRLDGQFVELEENPESTETLSSIFRTIHTIKGTCGFLELSRLESVTHAGENLLSSLRDGKVSINDENTTALLHLVDAVREMLSHIEETGTEADKEYKGLVATLKALQEPEGTSSADEPRLGEVLVESGTATASDVDKALAAQSAGDVRPLGEIIADSGAATPEKVSSAITTQKELSEANRPPKTEGSISGSNIRVQVEQLDNLMNLAGELVLARNQILQSALSSDDAADIATAQRLNQITSELQERIMKVRMQPVGMLWSKFPRIVRDLSKQLGKQIKLEMQGKGTELDKTLLEAIKDPLTHLVRNAVDHGVEVPAVREALEKDATGTLTLAAYHEGGQVNIEIVDDGGGIDPEVIKAKAVKNGLITQDEAASMSDRQAFALIFHAGLSTAKAVTNVSGRGVGMDVVKTNIEKIGGTVEVNSKHGKGTTIRIKIPLTLAIIPALIVTSANDRYAIPQVSLVELVRLDGEAARTGIEDLHGSPVYRLRGDLLPLLFLDEQLDVKDPTPDDVEQCRNIVVVRAADQLFGLVVDDINDTEEIVVKPLDQQTKSVPVYAGTTILGDGSVALILDVMGLAQRAGVIGDDGHSHAHEVVSETEIDSVNVTTFLMLQTSEDRLQAIDLADVDRLEEFKLDAIERTGNVEVVQYRGEIMPLIRVADSLGLRCGDGSEKDVVHVVVHSRHGASVGLVVDTITDIVEARDPVRRSSTTPGVKSAVIIDGKVADELDLDVLIGSLLEASIEDDVTETETGEDAIDAGTRQFCTFYLDDLFFGVDVTQVQEVLRHQPMTRVPLASDVVSGLINLRGQTITALDMRKRLSLAPLFEEGVEVDPEQLPMNVLLRTRDGVVSILVDRIGDVLTVEDTTRAPVPATVGADVRALLTDVYKLDGSLLLPLDIERLVAVADQTVVAQV